MQKKRLADLSGSIFLCFSSVGHGHGYIDISRGKLCAQGSNTGCGSIVYEPQSLEGSDRFPEGGPPDGQIASAGSSRFSELNEQSPTRWHKTAISPGDFTFNWHFTAVHRTRDWRYFITNPGWNSSQPLSRDAFELTPFCTHEGHNGVPPTDVAHPCVVPERSGYHVILAVWDVGDTANSFYNVLDVDISGSGPVEQWLDIGDINPSMDLSAGDSVLVRLFDANGELFDRNVEMEIVSDAEGEANNWPRVLAEYIPTQADDLLAGLKNTDGDILPSFGRNDIFASRDSDVIRAEVEPLTDGSGLEPDISVEVSEVSFPAHVPLSLDLTVTTNQMLSVAANLYFQDVSIGYAAAEIQGTQTLNIAVDDPAAGDYQLVVTGTQAEQGGLDQETVGISVFEVGGSEYDYPEGRGSYQVGTIVTGQDGNLYECQVAPWCNRSPTYFAPGLGLAWGIAWIQVGSGTPPSPSADYVYPDGRGQYGQGTVVEGRDGRLYRCDIAGWCNSSSALYYAPGIGLAWDSAWTRL